MKAFLSHSSKQKKYVEQVAEILGKDKIICDSLTFEAGGRTLDEIYKGIGKSGIFVFFISIEALDSRWVEKELVLAEKFVNENESIDFIPILIDKSIDHKSDKIPEWMKYYNIKNVQKPGKAAFIIKNKIFMHEIKKAPNLEKEEKLFIGRNEERNRFEELYSEKKPKVILISGLPKVGKQKFIRRMLKDYLIIEDYYKPITITLNRRSSIEDLIMHLYKLGYSKNYRDMELIKSSMEEKIATCKDLIYELRECGEMLFIIDDKCIFRNSVEPANWFIKLINSIDREGDELYFCITSTSKFINQFRFFQNNEIIYISLNEFNRVDRKNYFESLMRIYDIELNNKDLNDILEILSGMPDQIKFTKNILLSRNYNLTSCIEESIKYQKNNSQVLVSEYETNNLAMQLLKLLSMGEFFSYALIYDLFNDKNKEIKDLLAKFSNDFLLEEISDMNYIKLTDSIRDYIERKSYSLDNKIMQRIKSKAEEILNTSDSIFDYSEISFYSKEALKIDIEMPRKNIMPSFYLNAMRELYNQEKRYSTVVKLADKVLEYSRNIDSKFIDEVVYWCCLSLARQKNRKVLRYVNKINGVEHNFILGFYYRIIGDYDKSLDKLITVINEDKNHFRAKRELVQVYLNREEYDLAYDFARQTFEIDPLNPYNIQGYLRCIIKKKDIDNKENIIQDLLNSLKTNSHKKADEMYLTSKAQVICYIKGEYEKSINEINEAIDKYPDSIYPILIKLEIIKNQEHIDYDMLSKTISNIEAKFSDDSDIFKKIIYIYSKTLVIKKYELNDIKAESYFNREKASLPQKVIENIEKLLCHKEK